MAEKRPRKRRKAVPPPHPLDPSTQCAPAPPSRPSKPTHPSAGVDASAPSPAPSTSKMRRDKRKCHAHRKIARQRERVENPSSGRTPRSATVLKHIAKAELTKTKMDASNIPTTSTGFTSLPDEISRVYSLQELLDDGFELVTWDGKTARAIVDANDLVIAVLVGHPDVSDWTSVAQSAFEEVQKRSKLCKFSDDDTVHRRGSFAALNAGISFGGGQTAPGNLYHCRTNTEQLGSLISHNAFVRIAGFAAGALKAWCPKLYDYYEDHFDDLLERHPRLNRNFSNSVWAAAAINFGPQTVTAKHRDFANLPFGMCSITALGNFDPTKGGHLVAWELKLIIEFPPGSTILLPSAAVSHSNTPIGDGETRALFTQYSAGGLFRWTEHGYQLERKFNAKLSVSQKEDIALENEERCKVALSLFSTLAELRAM